MMRNLNTERLLYIHSIETSKIAPMNPERSAVPLVECLAIAKVENPKAHASSARILMEYSEVTTTSAIISAASKSKRFYREAELIVDKAINNARNEVYNQE